MPYNPFDKPISDVLVADDLQQLIKCSVAEGYYVEYKSEFPKNEKIGRSIASFANSYGGWYIVGVKTDEHNVATEICGFSLASCPDPTDKVREIIKSHINPTPVFYPQVVPLEEGKAVFVVHIPDGQDKPFISKDARIYRRVSDSSDPVPETNRYTIDKLYEEGREAAKQFEEFCRDERTFSQAENRQGWVQLFLSPYPLGMFSHIDIYSTVSIEEIVQLSRVPIKLSPSKIFSHESVNITVNPSFNSAQLTSHSVILRQIQPTHLAFNSLEVELFRNGQARFLIPLEYFPPLKEWNREEINSVSARQTLYQIFVKNIDNASYLYFFDIGKLWLTVAVLLTYYKEWLGKKSGLNDFKLGIKIQNVWRHVPLFDSNHWSDYVTKIGVPVIHRNELKPTKNSGYLTSWTEENPLWIEVCWILSVELGLPGELLSKSLIKAIIREVAKKTNTKNI